MGVAPDKLWVLTVVTKEDLWYSSGGDVERHYSSGRHAELIESVRAARSDGLFRYERLTLS